MPSRLRRGVHPAITPTHLAAKPFRRSRALPRGCRPLGKEVYSERGLQPGSRVLGPTCEAWCEAHVKSRGKPWKQRGGPVTQPNDVSTPAQDATVLERALFEMKRVIV